MRFDLQARGSQTIVGWVASSDGLLARDLDGDGLITSGAELFGDATQLADGSTATDGFVALAELDENGDGRVDEADSGFDALFVWRDFDSDGFSDSGELQSLASAGVDTLQLSAQTVSWWQAGNEVRLASTYQNQLGQEMALVDVWFAVVPLVQQLEPNPEVDLTPSTVPSADESAGPLLPWSKPW